MTPAETSSSPPSKGIALAALLAANVLLAFGPWFVRLSDVGPVASAFWRLALAVPFLAAGTLLARGRSGAGGGGVAQPIPRAVWLLLAGAGVFFAADLSTWHAGILHTKMANATLLGNSASFLFPIYGFLVARSWPDRWQGGALLLAGLGMALLLGRSYELSAVNLMGDLLSVLAGLFYTVYLILMLRVRGTMGPMPALLLSTAAGVPVLALAVPLMGESFAVPSIWPLIALALCSQVIGQGLMIYAIVHLSPLVVGLALLVQPAVAVGVGWLAYGETLAAPDLAGAALIAVALVLVRRDPKIEGAAQLEPPGLEEDKAA